MRIQTTEVVRRFNAQTELVDIALEHAADEITDPGRLFALLCLAGHHELKDTFEESMRRVCISGSGWPTGAGLDPGQSPHMIPASSTKSPIDSVLYACRIVKDFLADERTQYLLNASGSRTSEYSRAFLEIVGAIALLEKTHNWREFCQNSARPGDVANVILERDSLLLQKEAAIFALKRSFYEADAIAEGRNKVFICAPVVRDYCRGALKELGVTV